MKLIKFKDSGLPAYMLQVRPSEALALIESLSRQLHRKDPNSGRLEISTVDNEYFSIAVDFDGEPHD